jgi:hypothetical protein
VIGGDEGERRGHHEADARPAGKRQGRRCPIPAYLFVEKVWSGPSGAARQPKELHMALYLIAFNDEWVPDLTMDVLRERGERGLAVIAEITAAGEFVFSDGGLDASTVVCNVVPNGGTPLFTDGPFVETKEHLGGFAVVDVPDDDRARHWAGKIAEAIGWPQEVHRFPSRIW